MTATPGAPAREAEAGDNDGLVALSVACPMEGDITLAVDRAPDFFALNRLEGASWRVGVVDRAKGTGGVAGCIAVAERTVYCNGEPTSAMYVSDLKVHPDHRGSAVADTLSAWAQEVCLETGGPDVLVFLTVLAGNRAMERRMPGPRGLPRLRRVATLRTHTVPILWRRRPPDAGVTLSRAGPADLEEMCALWSRVARRRQFAPVLDAGGMAAWIDAAPSLEVSSYRLARRTDGALAGFLATWDQSAFKRLRVMGYSPRLAGVRAVFNTLGPAVGATRLLPPGGALRNLTAAHLCVPGDEPAVLRALVVDAYNAARGKGFSFLNIGLDVTDPLAVATKGMFAQPVDVWICTASPAGAAEDRVFELGPFHHEIALV